MNFSKSLTVSCFCSLLCLSTLSANEHKAKIYIPKDSIKFTKHGAFMHVNKNYVFLETLYSDKHGFYTYDTKLLEKMPDKECSNGHRYDAWMDHPGFGGCGECRKNERKKREKNK